MWWEELLFCPDIPSLSESLVNLATCGEKEEEEGEKEVEKKEEEVEEKEEEEEEEEEDKK